MAANFSAPFSQAKGFGSVWGKGPFLGGTEVCEGTGDIPAWHLWSEGRGEHQGVKAIPVFVHVMHESRGFPRQGVRAAGTMGKERRESRPGQPRHPALLPACSGIPLCKLCSESAITCKRFSFPKDLSLSSLCPASVWLSLYRTNFVSAFFEVNSAACRKRSLLLINLPLMTKMALQSAGKCWE